MRHVLEEMYALLLEQKQAQEELLCLSREKGRVIINGNIERLNEIVSQERKTLRTVSAVEKKRAALAPETAASLGIPEAELTVSAIIARAEPEEREPFIRMQAELLGLIRDQTELNESNQELLRAQMEYTDAIMELLVQSEDPLNNFYGDDGREQTDRKKTSGLFDTQV